jgi:ketosteroid isomerase-like protein
MPKGGPIAEILEVYAAAVHAKDVDAFIELYGENVCVFDTWGWSYDGVDAWREVVTNWFGSLGNESVVVELKELETVVSEDLSFAHAFVTFKGLSAKGEELRTMDNRLTWALQLGDDGSWKVVHEHTSAPADFEDGKIILQR